MKLRGQEKIVLGGLAALAYGTGAVLFVLGRYVRVATAVGEQHHPAEGWSRMLHSAVAYAAVVAFGYLLRGHVLPGLRSGKKQRMRSGLANVVLFGVLVLTALVTLYGGESEWTAFAALSHGLVGLALPGFIAVHALRKRATPHISHTRKALPRHPLPHAAHRTAALPHSSHEWEVRDGLVLPIASRQRRRAS